MSLYSFFFFNTNVLKVTIIGICNLFKVIVFQSKNTFFYHRYQQNLLTIMFKYVFFYIQTDYGNFFAFEYYIYISAQIFNLSFVGR